MKDKKLSKLLAEAKSTFCYKYHNSELNRGLYSDLETYIKKVYDVAKEPREEKTAIKLEDLKQAFMDLLSGAGEIYFSPTEDDAVDGCWRELMENLGRRPDGTRLTLEDRMDITKKQFNIV